MFRIFMISFLVSLAFLHLVAGGASAREAGNNKESFNYVDTRNENRPQEPKFPPPDEIEKIRSGKQSFSYPRVKINVGIGQRKMNNGELEKSFDLAVEETVGFSTTNKKFSDNLMAMNFGIRLIPIRQLSVWLQFQGTATSEKKTESDALETQAMSVSFLYTYHFKSGNSPSISLGAGFLSQTLRANRRYGIRLPNSNGTLEYVHVDVEAQSAGILVGLFEVPLSQTTSAGLYFSGQAVVGGPSEDEEIGRIGVSPLRVGMRGYWLTAGLSFGI